MKVARTLHEAGDHRWIAIARDPERPDHLIDTVEYLVVKGDRAALLDPGGQEIFPAVFGAVVKETPIDAIAFIFASHQDPDAISSLPLWLTFNPRLRCYVSWLWTGFLPHFGGSGDTFVRIPDEGATLPLNGLGLEAIPAHYMHSSGNFHLYDPVARILFTGDIGGALLPDGARADLFVRDFDRHVEYMRAFHARWMGSNEAKNNWVDHVAELGVEMLCPQHGAILKGGDVARFLQWLRDLDVGREAIALNRGGRTARRR
jgi:flavorubredoxin